mmetsp:Transcript_14822/g.22974  ORF Transcript_14822/g.22974 Transcript_14822/m.22974 type:complete len:224 (+) Transcript_14822:206-877(+)
MVPRNVDEPNRKNNANLINLGGDETGLSLFDAPSASEFACGCGRKLTRHEDMQKHSLECKYMNSDGYTAMFSAMSKKVLGCKSAAEKSKLVSNIQAMVTALKDAPLRHLEEEKNPFDMDIADLSSAPPKKSNNPFQRQEQSENLLEMNLDDFMDAGERERANTYMKQVQKEAEEKTCKFCNKQITELHCKQENVTFLQTSECFHQVHVDCLREAGVKEMSESR